MSLAGEVAYAKTADRGHLLRKPYDQANWLREFSLGLGLIQRHGQTGALLDLGCGSGWSSVLFRRAGFDVTAVDVAPAMIEVLEESAAARNVRLDAVVADVTELGFPRRMLDRALRSAGLVGVQHHHDPGESYRGVLGLCRTLLASAADFCFAWPRRRRIVTARKPSATSR